MDALRTLLVEVQKKMSQTEKTSWAKCKLFISVFLQASGGLPTYQLDPTGFALASSVTTGKLIHNRTVLDFPITSSFLVVLIHCIQKILSDIYCLG